MKLSGKSSSDNYQINELILSDVKLLSELITLCTTIKGLQALISVILHLLLSTSYVLPCTKIDDQKQLLLAIIQFIENIFSTNIDKNILHFTMIIIINLRTNCVLGDNDDETTISSSISQQFGSTTVSSSINNRLSQLNINRNQDQEHMSDIEG
ncbi:unnamed protein product [Rotaria sp. Silwood2]|nr:unnamed protein product [Rotaria sp. Silwood2]